MSVMISENKKELIVTCKCGCEDTIHIRVNDKDKESDYYAIQTILSGNWYRDQDDRVLRCIGRKLKKELDKRKKEIQKKLDDEYYASKDETYAEMLRQYESL